MIFKNHKILAFFLFCMIWSSHLKAYGPCDQDGEKLCGDLGHKETLKNCLHRLKHKTSPECQQFLKSQEGAWQKLTASWAKVLESCKDEVGNHCKETLVAPGEDSHFKNMKDQQVCLMMKKESLKAPCKNEINRHMREFQPNLKEI